MLCLFLVKIETWSAMKRWNINIISASQRIGTVLPRLLRGGIDPFMEGIKLL